MKDIGIILDLEGTLLSNGIAVTGASELLHHLMDNEIPYRIITNTVSKSLSDLSEMFHKIGFDIPETYFINPVVTLRRFLIDRNTESFYFVGPDKIENNLGVESVCKEFPEYVILCDFENIHCDYELLNTIFTYVHKGGQLLTMSNSDYYLSKNGPKLDTGAFSKMFETVTGNKALIFGKPSIMIYEEASKQMKIKNSKIIAIGDDVLTDIQGANEFGAFSVLVKTGKYKEYDETRVQPKKVIDNLKDAMKLLEEL